MTDAEIEQKIKDILVEEFECDPAKLKSDTNLFTELDLDSIDALELGMAIKKTFGVTFSSDAADNKKTFYSVKTLADHVEAQQGTAQ